MYDGMSHRLKNEPVATADRERYSLNDDEVLKLARWALVIEEHYTRKRGTPTPMDIEWAKDSRTDELYIVQARPETVHSQKQAPLLKLYHLLESGTTLAQGLAIGDAIAAGPAPRDP